ncbi:Fe-S cluster assembly ATPase SufC [Butyrivibrio sp. NC3005]|uniref:Fe-S cluster assembly ATPase SufC n=1 Tax=Butyrivibrio sp. NC3005 TaxID=1280685 RepID=UPI0003F87AB3|nr:Fe-S cluster assembly ATPase SufC [Butyrivibrio sp. NC3005]
MNTHELLKIENLSVNVSEKEILKGLNLEVNEGEVHVLLGPNGAGKSTLGNAIMGNPSYEITDGKIFFNQKDITDFSADKRAAEGLFMSFQNPIEVPGIRLGTFIRNAISAQTKKPIKLLAYKKKLEEAMKILGMDNNFADRDLNVGFSGGEKKKAEILQLLMLSPKLAILDETDSGLDVDAVRTVSKGVKEYQKRENGALIIITHSTRILESLKIDKAHILIGGRIVKSGGPELVEEINNEGFEKYEQVVV